MPDNIRPPDDDPPEPSYIHPENNGGDPLPEISEEDVRFQEEQQLMQMRGIQTQQQRIVDADIAMLKAKEYYDNAITSNSKIIASGELPPQDWIDHLEQCRVDFAERRLESDIARVGAPNLLHEDLGDKQ